MIRLIDVTQDDINNGVKCNNNECAIARALKREYKTNDVSVVVYNSQSTPQLIVNKKKLKYNHERDILDFIDCFDNTSTEDNYYRTPQPFTLQINE